jgi:hypothetical protein
MNIVNLFPTALGSYELDRKLTKKELKFISDLDRVKNEGNSNSKDNYIFKNPELKGIADFCQGCLESYAQLVYAPRENIGVYITQAWANWTKPGEFHHKHAHQNSFISGVFYVNADPEKDKIFFYRDRLPTTVDLPTENYNTWNSSSWWMPSGTCGIYLFPSYLTHMVQTVEAESERISIAFNSFVDGYLGCEKNLTGLRL